MSYLSTDRAFGIAVEHLQTLHDLHLFSITSMLLSLLTHFTIFLILFHKYSSRTGIVALCLNSFNSTKRFTLSKEAIRVDHPLC